MVSLAGLVAPSGPESRAPLGCGFAALGLCLSAPLRLLPV